MKINFSIRTLLVFLIVTFTTVPVLLFGIYEARRAVQGANEQIQEFNRQAALLIERDIVATVEKYDALYEALAADIDLRSMQFNHPEEVTRVLKSYPQTGGLFLMNEKAVSVAAYPSDLGYPINVDFSDAEQITLARKTLKTSISGNRRGRVSGLSSILFTVPLIADGSLRGFMSGSVRTEYFRTTYQLAPEQFAVVIDAFNRVVSSSSNTREGATLETSIPPQSHLYTEKVEPIGWTVTVGVPDSYVSARVREAIRSTVLIGLLCALIGAGAAGLIAFATTRGLDRVGQQVQGMSSAHLQPITLTENGLYPSEIRSLIGKFNNLLDRAARTRQAEFEAISQVADTILIVKTDGQITYVNEAGARLFGDVHGRPLDAVIGAEAAATVLSPQAPRDWKGDVSLTKADGSSFDAFLSSTSILENDKLTSVVAIVQDITQEKAAREAMVQSEKMITLGELVAGTSHELNNPLAIVTGYSDLLLEEAKFNPEQRAKVESIRKNAIRASNVVHSLLAFARKRKPERTRTDVNTVVEAAAELKEYDLRTSGIRVDKDLAPSLPSVFADPNQLQQVILNVINNAQDAVLSGSRTPAIAIRTGTSDGRVFIRIEDSGSGISRENLKKVFDPFFTTKPVGKGTGLGLSISYGIIHEHGGEIRIQSQLGQGTEVRIELPFDHSDPVALAVSGAERGKTPARRYLVVDDEADMAAILQVDLSRKGNMVDTAGNIEDALKLAKKSQYDFVITDMKMPGGSGIDLYKQLCAISPSYSSRVVFLTGDTSNPSTIQFLEKEGLPYFAKPFDLESMHAYFAKRESRPTRG